MMITFLKFIRRNYFVALLRLFKYGRSFMHNTFELDTVDKEGMPVRSELVLWDRTTIWNQLPELSYNEFAGSEGGLHTWLDMFHKVRKSM